MAERSGWLKIKYRLNDFWKNYTSDGLFERTLEGRTKSKNIVPNGERNDMVLRETDIVRCPAIGRRDPRKQGAKRLVRLGAARIRFDRIGDLPAESRSRGILGELLPARGPMQSISRLAAEGPCRNIVGSELSSLEERSVSSRGRCVWLTSRPSWPLEGGRPREVSRSRARYRLLGHARGPSSHHPRSNLDTTPRVVVHEQRGWYPAAESRYVRARASSTTGDRIMFRYLDDGRSLRNVRSHPWRAPAKHFVLERTAGSEGDSYAYATGSITC